MKQLWFNHALVIGGTGMLRGVTSTLAASAHTVTVVGRNSSRLLGIVQEAENVVGIPIDYHDEVGFEKAIHKAINQRGQIDMAVVWIHDSAPRAPLQIAKAVGSQEHPAEYFQILGSAIADPFKKVPNMYHKMSLIPNIHHHEIILGFVLEDCGSRWLTDEEICRGVLAAIAAVQHRYIVGSVTPWSARP